MKPLTTAMRRRILTDMQRLVTGAEGLRRNRADGGNQAAVPVQTRRLAIVGKALVEPPKNDAGGITAALGERPHEAVALHQRVAVGQQANVGLHFFVGHEFGNVLRPGRDARAAVLPDDDLKAGQSFAQPGELVERVGEGRAGGAGKGFGQNDGLCGVSSVITSSSVRSLSSSKMGRLSET